MEFTDISLNERKGEVRFSREEGRNPSSVLFNTKTLSFKCFSTNDKGNIYTLVMNKKNITFTQSLDYIANLLGLEKNQFNKNISLPFKGFYKRISKDLAEPEYSMPTYDEEILEQYLNKYNMMFFNDGIDFEVQNKYKIGYDFLSERITVPIWTLNGKLCGIMGRSIDKKCDKADRWLPIIPCSRSLTVYSYTQHYNYIQQKGLSIVGESEKLPMQMESFGSNIGLATSGCHISDVQARYIKGLLIPKVILAYDEGLEEDFIREEAEKLKVDNKIYTNQVGYIYDRNNKYLPIESKASPTDFGRDTFTRLVKECTVWI